jgi:hypothetical protein
MRRLIDIEIHRGVSAWIQGALAEASLPKKQTVGIAATTMGKEGTSN